MRLGRAVMVFTCSFCALMPGVKGRKDAPGKCKLTDDNFAGASYLLKQLWPASAPIIEQLTLPATLCLECLTSEHRSKISIRSQGRRSEAEMLVGLPAAMWDEGQRDMKEGDLVDLAPGGLLAGYIIEWRDGTRTQMTDDEARDACALGRWLPKQLRRPTSNFGSLIHKLEVHVTCRKSHFSEDCEVPRARRQATVCPAGVKEKYSGIQYIVGTCDPVSLAFLPRVRESSSAPRQGSTSSY